MFPCIMSSLVPSIVTNIIAPPILYKSTITNKKMCVNHRLLQELTCAEIHNTLVFITQVYKTHIYAKSINTDLFVKPERALLTDAQPGLGQILDTLELAEDKLAGLIRIDHLWLTGNRSHRHGSLTIGG